MQTYDPLKPISGTTKISQLYQIIRDHVNSLVSNFSGTAYPGTPVVGQHCFRTDQDIEYRYTAASGWAEVVSAGAGIGLEVVNARGSLGTLDQRLDVSHNEDGTLKASTSLNPSQWYTNTKASGISSSTAFISYGSDMTTTYYPTRRLKVNRSAGTYFTEVVSSSYGGGNTTVTVRDAVIVATLYSVEHSIIGPRKAIGGDGAVSYEMVANKQVALVGSTYTVLVGDSVILANGTFTITGINAAIYGVGRTLIVINIGTGTIVYDPQGSTTINGSVSNITIEPGQSLVLICDGTNWVRPDFPVSPGWIALTPATYWTSGSNPLYYMKDPMGFVHFKGHFRASSDSATSYPFNTALPVGYRPDAMLYFPNTLDNSTNLMSYSYIDTGGNLFTALNDASDWVFMNGVTYRAGIA
jgi:hypothetical protein